MEIVFKMNNLRFKEAKFWTLKKIIFLFRKKLILKKSLYYLKKALLIQSKPHKAIDKEFQKI